ncbi:Sb-PDE family phosphodiesterase, partial [Phocaeicola vulgatus]|nr:Sb-PDE family phosphodiesterase [Phocaeicola vulgatus]MDB0795492.1 Sb-PDE family phosphodiesterase [Phocaeicola vulgatus]
PLHLDYTKVIILILWWRNFQLEYWRNFQLVSTTNVTDLVLKLKKTAHDTLLVYFRDMTLKPHTRYTVRIGFKQGIKGGDVNFEVTNFIVAPDKGLKYTISL